jgi:hypothetical protein
MDAVFLSILVEQEKEIISLQEETHVSAGYQVRPEKQPDNKMD